MAAAFDSLSSKYLSTGSAPATTYPVTMACWRNLPAFGSPGVLMSLNANAGNNDLIRLVVLNETGETNASVIASLVSGTSFSSAGTANIWQHSAGRFTSSTSRQAFLNGVGGTPDTTDLTPTGINELLIGARRFGGAVGLYLDGSIAEAAIWSAALTDDEILSLAKGFTPDQIRPQSLVFYAPLIRELQDLRGGLTITNNNGANVSNHPRVIQ